MAKGKENINDFSETSCVPKLVRTLNEQPTPPSAPETFYLTSTPENLKLPSTPTNLKQSDPSRWKLLVGTPSRSPIPENILVPDPSPPRSISSANSPVTLDCSAQSSFINQRRQGEHVHRPPVWRVYDTEGNHFSSPSRLDTSGTSLSRPLRQATLSGIENQKPDHSSFKLLSGKGSKTKFEDQLSEITGIFTERPLLVNMLHTADIPENSENYEPRHISRDFATTNADPFVGPSANRRSTHRHSTSPPSASNVPSLTDDTHTEESDAPHHTPQNEVAEVIDSSGRPTTANTGQSFSQIPETSESSRGSSSAQPDVPNTAHPYVYVETPEDPRGLDLDRYMDLRVEPGENVEDWNHHIMVGSRIAFIGCTHWSDDDNNNKDYGVGVPLGTQCIVARIFGDHWALCLKLEPGLVLVEDGMSYRLFRRSPKVIETRCGPAVAVKTHCVLTIFAPLCAFTLSSNFGPFRSRQDASRASGQLLTASQGGTIRASPPYASRLYEEYAKRTKKILVPLRIYRDYLAFCDLNYASFLELDAGITRVEANRRRNVTKKSIRKTGRRIKEFFEWDRPNVVTPSRVPRLRYRNVNESLQQPIPVSTQISQSLPETPRLRISDPPNYGDATEDLNRSAGLPDLMSALWAVQPSAGESPSEDTTRVQPSAGERPADDPTQAQGLSTSVPPAAVDASQDLMHVQDLSTSVPLVAGDPSTDTAQVQPSAGEGPADDLTQAQGPSASVPLAAEGSSKGMAQVEPSVAKDPSEDTTQVQKPLASVPAPAQTENLEDNEPLSKKEKARSLYRMFSTRYFGAAQDEPMSEERIQRRSSTRKTISDAWSLVKHNRRPRPTILPQNPTESSVHPGLFDAGNLNLPRHHQTGAPESRRLSSVQVVPLSAPEASGSRSGPGERVGRKENQDPANSDTRLQDLPTPGGLKGHLRAIAPTKGIRDRIRSRSRSGSRPRDFGMID